MSLAIKLDNARASYSSLEPVSGIVVLDLPHAQRITSIVVVIEGTSNTAHIRSFMGQFQGRGRQIPATAFEHHKFFEKALDVFPLHSISDAARKHGLTVSAGRHEFPFSISMPLMTTCTQMQHEAKDPAGNLIVIEHSIDYMPPSFVAPVKGNAIIYSVKVVGQMPGVFKSAMQNAVPVRVLPIDRPIDSVASCASYSRRCQFGSIGRSSLPSLTLVASLAGRAALTLNTPVPLELEVRKSELSSVPVVLQELDIRICEYTDLRALELQKTVEARRSIVHLRNMQHFILGDQKMWTRANIESDLWNLVRLPLTFVPSFKTCNIWRRYELEVACVLASYDGDILVMESSPTVLRIPVEMRTGISAPNLERSSAASSRPSPIGGDSDIESAAPQYTSLPPAYSDSG